MFGSIECLVAVMLSEGASLTDIVVAIGKEFQLDEVYAQGLLKFKVNDDGEVICIGENFIDCIVKPCDCSSLSEVSEKFKAYFSRSVYLLTDDCYIIDRITYGDLDQYSVLTEYIWGYLKHRITM